MLILLTTSTDITSDDILYPSKDFLTFACLVRIRRVSWNFVLGLLSVQCKSNQNM